MSDAVAAKIEVGERRALPERRHQPSCPLGSDEMLPRSRWASDGHCEEEEEEEGRYLRTETRKRVQTNAAKSKLI